MPGPASAQPAPIYTTGGGCEMVQGSKYGVLAGIPVTVPGLAARVGVFGPTVWSSELLHTLTAAVAAVAAAFAVYLVVLQLWVIDTICVWCMANDLLLTPLLAILAFMRLRTAED